ncbi:hypothetical protein COO72_12505, partial [Bifidobacterium callitrichos]
WKRVLKGAAGVTVAAALCVAAAMPANGADGNTGTGTGDAAAPTAESTTVTDATSFLDAVFPCKANESKTIVIGGNIDLTAENVENYDAARNDMQCSLELVSDGLAQRQFTWTGTGSLFWPRGGGSVTIGRTGDDKANMLKFTSKDNGKAVAGPLFHNYGTLTIRGGEFSGLHANKGPVAYNEGTGTMTVTGGTFTGNTADATGGVIYQEAGGSMTVTGGTFTGNTAASGGAVHQKDSSMTVTGGTFTGNTAVNGGAIYSEGTSKLTIWGGHVTFDGNRSRGASFMEGGGAIWANGELHVKNDSEGKPKFTNNQALAQAPGKDGKLGAGGAGGAIFFHKGEAYIIGGDYQNNKSGYLGGAIYTEEGSTTYVGKAVAFENTAGHFGGGLWFCPSGNSAASKGGNIALFDN